MAYEAELAPVVAMDASADGIDGTANKLLSRAVALLPSALSKARQTEAFPGRWKVIVDRLLRVQPCLSDLASHPCFDKNALCRELLKSVVSTLSDALELSDRCRLAPTAGKLRMQSDLDALVGKLDLNLQDCSLLVKTGVLGNVPHSPPLVAAVVTAEPQKVNVCELFARLQIGHAEAKHQAMDDLLEAIHEDDGSFSSLLCRSNISALIRLLATASPKMREKTAAVICLLAESGSCQNMLVSEGVLPPLIRLAESGSLVGREKAVIALQRLSVSADIARAVAGHGGIRPLVENCDADDSILQFAAAGTLKNLSAVPEVRQQLAEEGIIRLMINLLDCGTTLQGCKEHATECLQNMTSGNDGLKRSVVSEGGLRSLLHHLDGSSPQESPVTALRNLVGLVSTESLLSLGLLPRLIHVLRNGSIGAQQAAASTICKISTSTDTKRLIGESGCIPLLIRMLQAKSNSARELAAQAMASLITYPQNAREVKKDEKSVPTLVQLLDPSPLNTAKKYSVSCLLLLSSSKRSKKLMISHGAIGYLKKLSEMDVAGAKKLLERLERGKLRNLFSRN